MGKRTEAETVADDYQMTLEKAKGQYRQYLEVSELCELAMNMEKESVK